MNCPKCDQPMEHQDDEPDVGVPGGYLCEACDVWVDDADIADSGDYF